MLKAISIKLSESNVSGVINTTECTAQTFITSYVSSFYADLWFYFALTSIKLSSLLHLSKRTVYKKIHLLAIWHKLCYSTGNLLQTPKGDEYNLIYFRIK